MGRATRWFRGLFGLKNTQQDKKKSCSTKLHNETDRPKYQQAVGPRDGNDEDASKRAIAVAAATAAVAEAAVAAAQAAATVLQLTTSGRGVATGGSCGPAGNGRRVRRHRSREEWAAVTIQSHFRGSLSRKALRALKGLVKLQALVRGFLVRKQTAYALRRLQALVRAQVRARVGRAVTADSSMKTCYYNHLGPATPEKSERVPRHKSWKHGQYMALKRSGSESTESETYDAEKYHADRVQVDNQRSGSRTTHLTDDERSDKILEVDSGNQNTTSKSRRLFYSSSYHSLGSDRNCQSFSTSKDTTTARQSIISPSSGEVQSFSYVKVSPHVDDNGEDNLSPTFYSASSRGGGSSRRGDAFTPTKSDGARSCLSNYVDHPNYMATTESAKAKVRSLSAPKQRPPFERSSSTKRYSIHGYGDSRPAQRAVASLANRAYPGSGYLDKLGMPVRSDGTVFSSQLRGY